MSDGQVCCLCRRAIDGPVAFGRTLDYRTGIKTDHPMHPDCLARVEARMREKGYRPVDPDQLGRDN